MRRLGTASALALAAVAAAGCTLDGDDPPDADGPAAAVTVRLDSPVATKGSMNGFIHSLSADRPPDHRIAPLAPRLWRSDLTRAPAERALALGAHYQVVLSDLWGYPGSDWQGRGPPWANLRRWEAFVRRVARAHRGQPLSWDIWNEPDTPTFWRGGRERFFATFAVANRVLRQELGPGAVIGGPSISRYSPEWIGAFLDHCLGARCRIDFLSWHENLRPDDSLSSIGAHLADARGAVLADPRYAALGMRAIHVNEYVGREDRYLPGEAVAYLDELERGGADLAARSCWSEEDCGPAGLDGLLHPADGTPRAVWWVHRWYAQAAGARLAAQAAHPGLRVLAGRTAENRVEVLIGHAPQRGDGAPPPSPAVPVDLFLAGAGAREAGRLRVERLPATGDQPLPSPLGAETPSANVTAKGVHIRLPPLGPHEAMRVTAG